MLLHGPPGLGKTTLAGIIAQEMGVNIRITSGPAIEKPGDLAALLTDAMLCMAAEGALFLELASPPGGFDRTLAENIGLHVVAAPGLPGTYAPRSAAALIRGVIRDVLREQYDNDEEE